jgi:AcrR family transcriptional regulator
MIIYPSSIPCYGGPSMTARRTRSLQLPAQRNARVGEGELSSPPAPKVLNSTRVRILSAAEQLFAEHGYDRVSMPMIAEASGITAGAIYKHFEGKEALFFEVVRRVVQSVPITAESRSDAVMELPRIVAGYTTRRFRLLRQFAVEIHSASAKHPKVRRLLRQGLDRNIGQIRESIIRAQRAGALERADSELLACAVIVFVMGLMHMETLLPHFIGDPRWHDFVEKRMAALLGTLSSNPNFPKA